MLLSSFIIIPRRKISGWYCFGVVRPKPFRPSFGPDSYLGTRFSDYIVILQEYELAYEDGSYQV